jgi:ribonuclease BN (tRNA processing enzyme)
VKLIFLGTRGEIDARSRRHRMHSALLVCHRRGRILVDCGSDWLGKFGRFRPNAVVLTHAHPDHAAGLRGGSPYPVFGTAQTLAALSHYPLASTRVIAHETPVVISGVMFEPFRLEHSILAPAVGYRITAGRSAVFYAPDVAAICNRLRALRGVRLYIGDGATLTRPLLRRRGDVMIGHASIRTQLAWCERAGVGQAIFTHCGSAIVAGDEAAATRAVEAMGRERGIRARVAYDGLELRV